MIWFTFTFIAGAFVGSIITSRFFFALGVIEERKRQRAAWAKIKATLHKQQPIQIWRQLN